MPRNKLFHFEEIWLTDPKCGETVEAAWLLGREQNFDTMVLERIQKCGKDPSWWSRNCFGNARTELEKKKILLVMTGEEAIRARCNHNLRKLKCEINILLDREEKMWG